MLIRLLDKRSETQRVPARPSRNEAGTTDRKIADLRNGGERKGTAETRRGAARRSRKSVVRRGPKVIRGRRFLSSGPFNRRDAKSAERETFPSIFSLHCHSRDCSQPAKKRRGLPRPVYRSVRSCLRSSVIADHVRRLLYSFGVSRQYAGAPDGTPGF